MSEKDPFYIGYSETPDKSISSFVKKAVIVLSIFLILGVLAFSLGQNTFKNSSFELTNTTKITGVFHEQPYPMLRVPIGENSYKNILLLGFGKSSANPFFKKIIAEKGSLNHTTLSIEGNLIYYNGKTLLQITNDEKITQTSQNKAPIIPLSKSTDTELVGEIIDPKCYFGVMKPGKGKIHRSCAIRCISGGIPPVLVTTTPDGVSEYFLLTDMQGKAINKDILSFVGKPVKIKGRLAQLEDWNIVKVEAQTGIKILSEDSTIY